RRSRCGCDNPRARHQPCRRSRLPRTRRTRRNFKDAIPASTPDEADAARRPDLPLFDVRRPTRPCRAVIGGGMEARRPVGVGLWTLRRIVAPCVSAGSDPESEQALVAHAGSAAGWRMACLPGLPLMAKLRGLTISISQPNLS